MRPTGRSTPPKRGTAGLRRRLLLAFGAAATAYLVIEAALTGFFWLTHEPDTVYWIFEDSGRTVQFDPVRGYRLTRTPSRWARFTYGELEYVGALRGNNRGFPDRDDFGPPRPNASPRFAVFGDSYTAGQFLGQNWPDHAEDLAKEAGRPIRLLNFAVDGAGLGNWWSILSKIVVAEDYQVDGVIFVVTSNDLQRTFTFCDDRDCGCHRIGWAPGWRPADTPGSLAEAEPHFRPTRGFILSPEEFEQALRGEFPSRMAPPYRPRLYVATKLLDFVRSAEASIVGCAVSHHPLAGIDPDDSPERDAVIRDIARLLDARGLPSLVIHVPLRETLLDPANAPTWPAAEARAFARSIGATFVDGGQMFAGLDAKWIRRHFLPYDGHWNQAGSNRFARFVLDQPWLREAAPRPVVTVNW